MSCLDGGSVLGELDLPVDGLGGVGAGGHEGVGGDVVQFRNLQTKSINQGIKLTNILYLLFQNFYPFILLQSFFDLYYTSFSYSTIVFQIYFSNSLFIFFREKYF